MSIGNGAVLVAVYGTLRVGGRLHHHLGRDLERSRVIAQGKIVGAIYEVGDDSRDVGVTYPGFVAHDTGWVVVEVVEILDDSLLAELDQLEGFDPTGTAVNEYTRRTVALHDVRLHDGRTTELPEAWVYEYVQQPVDSQRLIRSGDWISTVAERERDGAQPFGSSYL